MTRGAQGHVAFCGKPLRVAVAVAGLAAAAAAGATGLYATGPERDSSFVRFVNGTDVKIAISSDRTKGKLEIGTQGAARISSFLPIKAGVQMGARVAVGNQQFDIHVTAKPGEFITVAAVPDRAGGWKSLQLRETPSSFSSARSSLAAFNFDESCRPARVDSAGQSDGIFKEATPQAIQRRFVGAVRAQVQISCAGKPKGGPLDLGQLEPGERYSIFLLPAQPNGLSVKDAIESEE